MNWGDERYVRAYTRDTTDYLMWSWQAQALWWQLLRKFNRAGVLELGRHGLKGICAHLKMPWDLAEPALAELLDDGCVEHREGRDGRTYLFCASYIPANEATQSDKARQQAVRDRKKDVELLEELNSSGADKDVTQRDAGVTNREESSRAVTERHDASRDVTPCLPSVPSVPCLPSQTNTGDLESRLRRVLVPLEPPNPRFDFEAVYRTYPRKAGKAAGMKALQKAIRTTADFELFVATVARYVATKRAEGSETRFYKHWSTLVSEWRGMVEELAEGSNSTAPKAITVPAFSPEWARNFNLAAKEADMLTRGETPPWWALPKRWTMSVDHGGNPLIPVRDGKRADGAST